MQMQPGMPGYQPNASYPYGQAPHGMHHGMTHGMGGMGMHAQPAVEEHAEVVEEVVEVVEEGY